MQPSLIYLDFDGPLPANLVSWITTCAKLWAWPIAAIRVDRTRRGYHVVVGINKKLAPAHIVAAQAILGSDPKREAFTLMRVLRLPELPAFWRKRWNVLYSSHYRGVSIHAAR